MDHLLPSPGAGRCVGGEDTHQQQQRSPGPLGTHLGGERSHQHPPTPRHGGSITSDPPSPPRPGLTCRTPRSPPLPQSQCAHLPFWQRCGVRAECPAGTPRLCSAELRFTRSVTAGMNISWHALRDGSRELFMAHLETELMAREWAAARPPPRLTRIPFPGHSPALRPLPPPPGAAIPPCPIFPPRVRTPNGAQSSGGVGAWLRGGGRPQCRAAPSAPRPRGGPGAVQCCSAGHCGGSSGAAGRGEQRSAGGNGPNPPQPRPHRAAPHAVPVPGCPALTVAPRTRAVPARGGGGEGGGRPQESSGAAGAVGAAPRRGRHRERGPALPGSRRCAGPPAAKVTGTGTGTPGTARRAGKRRGGPWLGGAGARQGEFPLPSLSFTTRAAPGVGASDGDPRIGRDVNGHPRGIPTRVHTPTCLHSSTHVCTAPHTRMHTSQPRVHPCSVQSPPSPPHPRHQGQGKGSTARGGVGGDKERG